MILNCVLSINVIVFVVHVTLVKSNVLQKLRWNEHNNPNKSAESSRDLQSNMNHYFTWGVISNAPKMVRPRRT